MGDVTKLRDLLNLSSDDVEKAFAERSKSDSSAIAPIGLKGFAASVAADKLNEKLDTDLYELLALTWTKWKVVKDAAAKSKEKPDETIVATLGEHELKHKCYPTLTIAIGDVELPELKLTLELIAKFKSVRLSIAKETLIAISPGTASAVMKLSYNETKIKEQSTPEWTPALEIPLGRRWKIE